MQGLSPEIMALIGPDSPAFKAFCRREAFRMLQVYFDDCARCCPDEFHAGAVAMARAYRPRDAS